MNKYTSTRREFMLQAAAFAAASAALSACAAPGAAPGAARSSLSRAWWVCHRLSAVEPSVVVLWCANLRFVCGVMFHVGCAMCSLNLVRRASLVFFCFACVLASSVVPLTIDYGSCYTCPSEHKHQSSYLRFIWCRFGGRDCKSLICSPKSQIVVMRWHFLLPASG